MDTWKKNLHEKFSTRKSRGHIVTCRRLLIYPEAERFAAATQEWAIKPRNYGKHCLGVQVIDVRKT
jgi:hypothetical protein